MTAAPELEGRDLDGRYRLLRELERESVSRLYEAEHLLAGKRVAVRVLAPELGSPPTLRDRFLDRARGAARINHENVASVFDLGCAEDGTPYVVTELPQGEPLSARLSRAPLPVALACRLASEMLAGVSAAHAARVVHGRLDTNSVVLVEAGSATPRAKLVGFEKPPSASEADERGDLTAVAAALHEMLSGHSRGEPGQESELSTSLGGVPTGLARLVERALDGKSELCPRSAEEFREQLDRERGLLANSLGELWSNTSEPPASGKLELPLGDTPSLPAVAGPAPLSTSWSCVSRVPECQSTNTEGFWGISDSLLVSPKIPPAANTPRLDPRFLGAPEIIVFPTPAPCARERRRLGAALMLAGGALFGVLLAWFVGIF